MVILSIGEEVSRSPLWSYFGRADDDSQVLAFGSSQTLFMTGYEWDNGHWIAHGDRFWYMYYTDGSECFGKDPIIKGYVYNCIFD